MKSQPKEKTAAMPHRIINKTSLYLAPQVKVDRDDYVGYEAIVQVDQGQVITIQSSSKISPYDGRVFEYILAQWQPN